MRFSNITAAFALFLAGVSALEKPLDIKVEHAVECSRKTKRGKAPLHWRVMSLADRRNQATK